jgi:aldose 1-epimerase
MIKGCSVGRVANRISNAEFKLNDVTYKLDKNNGNHCLHGGNSGLSMKNWASDVIENGVKFSYLSLNGEGIY